MRPVHDTGSETGKTSAAHGSDVSFRYARRDSTLTGSIQTEINWIRFYQFFPGENYVTFPTGGGGGGDQVRVPFQFKLFYFHAVFGKNGQNNSLAPHLQGWRPSSGKSWIRHCLKTQYSYWVPKRWRSRWRCTCVSCADWPAVGGRHWGEWIPTSSTTRGSNPP